MSESEISTETAGALLQESIEVAIDIAASNSLHAFLMRHKIMPSKRVFKLSPMFLGTRELITREWAKMPTYSSETDIVEINNELSAEFTDAMVNSIALAFQNNAKKPKNELKRFIKANFTPSDLLRVLFVVRAQLDIKNFISSIALARGASLLKPTEIIAGAKPTST